MKVPNENAVVIYTEETDSHGAISLLQGQQVFLNRILSRDSGKGFSSRIYYRGVGEVPFKWEVQPGKPKVIIHEKLPADMLLPLSPPPAILSSRLAHERDSKPRAGFSNRVPFRLWRRKGKRSPANYKINMIREYCPSETNSEAEYGTQFWSSEGDSRPGSPTRSSSSSSSFSADAGCPPTVLPESAFHEAKLAQTTKKTGLIRMLNLLWSCINIPSDFTGAVRGL